MDIEVLQGSLLDVDVEVIVNAANSLGYMGGGVAGVIKRVAGREVEEEAVGQAPVPVGEAIMTSGGKTGFKGIIHAPTMEGPAMKIPVSNVTEATRAALKLAEKEKVASIAIPGMGTGVGGVSRKDAARAMVDVIKGFKAKAIKMVILIDIDTEMVDAWRGEIRGE